MKKSISKRKHMEGFSDSSTGACSCGPINFTSNSKKRYLITFIDDFSYKIWVYFLVEKLEAFINFKIFKSSVKKEIGSYIRGLSH